MFKTIAMIGFAAAMALAPVAAFAQTGTSSSYGSYGYGPRVPTHP